MRNAFRLLVTIAALTSLVGLGCMQDQPFFEPQGATREGPSPGHAFQSGEAAQSGLKLIKVEEKDEPAGGADVQQGSDATITKDTSGGGDVDPFADLFGFPI